MLFGNTTQSLINLFHFESHLLICILLASCSQKNKTKADYKHLQTYSKSQLCLDKRAICPSNTSLRFIKYFSGRALVQTSYVKLPKHQCKTNKKNSKNQQKTSKNPSTPKTRVHSPRTGPSLTSSPPPGCSWQDWPWLAPRGW